MEWGQEQEEMAQEKVKKNSLSLLPEDVRSNWGGWGICGCGIVL